MTAIKETLAESKIVRWFLRTLTGLILLNFTGYVLYNTWDDTDIAMGINKWSMVIGSIVTWAAWEAGLKYLNKKLEK